MRQNAQRIFQAGIDAADPYQAVKNCLIASPNQLEILLDPADPHSKRVGRWNKIHLLAFGKAACAMTKAARAVISESQLADHNIAVTNYENVTALKYIDVIGAGHPLPDTAGYQAAQKIIRQLKQAQAHDLVLVLISGGGSALIPCPIAPVTLQEKITTTDLLLKSGATINQINCVRKHLSQLKGGRLATLAAPADLHALILSDVLGDDLSAIASGPTVPDQTTFADAVAICQQLKIWTRLPKSVQQLLTDGAQDLISETGKAEDPVFKRCSYTLVGSNRISLQAIDQAAQGLNYQTLLYSDHLSGEASVEAEKLVIYAQQKIAAGFNQPIAILAGGETTVTVKGHGLGGRNQEMALAFALAANKYKLAGNWVFLSAGTDGRDGPTDAAGAIVDTGSIDRIMKNNNNPTDMLLDNNSYPALKSAQDLVITGATGTNVADLQILLIHPSLKK